MEEKKQNSESVVSEKKPTEDKKVEEKPIEAVKPTEAAKPTESKGQKRGKGKGKGKKGPAGPAQKRKVLQAPVIPISLPVPEGGPNTPIWEIHKDRVYPAGQRLEYEQPLNKWRRASKEAERKDKNLDYIMGPLREAAEIHRTVRLWAREWIKPGMKMIDIADGIEAALRSTAGANGGIERSIAFPTGLSINNIAAHWTPNATDTEVVLKQDDVLKVDIGVQVDGRVIDSAFTLSWNPEYDELLKTVHEATDAAIAAAGVDVRLADIGPIVEEVMEAGEVTIRGKTHQIHTVRNLMGHSLGLYQIHADKSIPNCKDLVEPGKMEEGDILAFETFGSTGRGYADDDPTLPTSHYMKCYGPPTMGLYGGQREKELLAHICSNFSTLAFARRWLDQAGKHDYEEALNNLVESGAVDDYPPLSDIPGSYVAQFEHTVVIKPSSKEVVSRGPDY